MGTKLGESNSGYWNGARRSPGPVSENGSLEGSWHLVVKIPKNDQSFELQLERRGDWIEGAIGWSSGFMVPIQEATFKVTS